MFSRLCNPLKFKTSAFLFGPRMTGKTTLLRNMDIDEYIDLLDPELQIQYRSRPRLLWERISALAENSIIVIDEIQRAPELLDYVQMGIDRLGQVFLLSGSSARKLRRGGANLLGGRALALRLHPLTAEETGEAFDLKHALQYGTLPKIAAHIREKNIPLAEAMLRGYTAIYVKEVIQAEAATRNCGAFLRFLPVAAQNNAQIIEFSNISRECSVPASTVKEYYRILDDTLLGFLLWPYDGNERKKARPKSYFFDCGVLRALQNRLSDPPTPPEQGFLFETWMVNELVRLRDYSGKAHEFSFWRERNHEIDILVGGGHGIELAIECKTGMGGIKMPTVKRFRERFPGVRLVVASSNAEKPRISGDVEILPFHDVLEIYRRL